MSQSTHATIDRDEQIVVEGPAAVAPEMAEQQSAAEIAAAEALAEAEKESAKILGKAVTAFKSARRAYFRGMIETGALCRSYVNQCIVGTNKSRAAALKACDASLAVWSDEALDVGKMMAAAAVVELCGIDVKRDKLAYNHFRDQYRQLVNRTSAADGTDVYTLLPGMESECVALVNGLIDSEAPLKEVSAKVAELVAEHARRDRSARDAAAAAARQEAEKARTERESADRAAQEAQREADKAAQVAAVTVDETEKRAAEMAAAEARARQEAADSAKRKAEQEAREAERKQRQEQRAAELAREREERTAERLRRKASAESGEAPSPLVKVMNAGTPKDVAGQLADALSSADSPTDLWEALLAALDNNPNIDRAFQRSVKAARVALMSASSAVA